MTKKIRENSFYMFTAKMFFAFDPVFITVLSVTNFSRKYGNRFKSVGYNQEAIQELNETLHLDQKNTGSLRQLILNELADVLASSGADLSEAMDYLWEAGKKIQIQKIVGQCKHSST